LTPRPRKGRGAVSNAEGRYERFRWVAFDDGWGSTEDGLPPLDTTVRVDVTRSIIATNDSPDLPFHQSVNPYRGCEHGCVYCFARPTHAYLGLSPGLDFETKLFVKPDAPKLLERELSKPGYRCELLALGTNTDPYQPIERRYAITRGILEVLDRYQHPVGVVTKSNLVLRDVDLLSSLAARGLVSVALSVTTLDPSLARVMEPRCPIPARRLEAIEGLARAGVPAGVFVAPVIPALNDHEIERILASAREAGASFASMVLLRLPLEVRPLFEEWLEVHVPGKAEHVMSLLRAMRGGKAYDASYGQRFTGQGRGAALLRWRFGTACRKLGLETKAPTLDTSRFRGAGGEQVSLF
jgi:DNA repair photolyase